MRTLNALPHTLHFIRLDNAAKQLGAQSKRQFLSDFRTLTHEERRAVAELLAEKEARQ